MSPFNPDPSLVQTHNLPVRTLTGTTQTQNSTADDPLQPTTAGHPWSLCPTVFKSNSSTLELTKGANTYSPPPPQSIHLTEDLCSALNTSGPTPRTPEAGSYLGLYESVEKRFLQYGDPVLISALNALVKEAWRET